jgi:Domain of unknown function (DUF222)/HNH endonuclease
MFRPPSLPEPLIAVLGEVRAWTREGAPLGVTADDRASWVVGLQQLRDAVDAALLDAVASFDAAGDGELLHGAASTQAWLRGALGVAPGEASERVRLARGARGVLNTPVERMRDGELTYDHVRAVERGIRHLTTEQQVEASVLLTDLAAQGDVTAVRTAGRHLRLVTDPDGALRDAQRQFERRYLTLSPLLDGMTAVDGLLDAESAALVTAALEPFLVPGGPEDRRSAAQRRADGLVEIVRSACDHRLLPEIASERPHLQVLLAGSTTEAPNADEFSSPTLSLGAGLLPQVPGGSALLHPVAVGRIACDAQVSRVLLSPEGLPVELGRSSRLFSPSQRRLLALRDGGCRFPGCHRPPSFTDAHHVHPWLDGGATDVRNGLLLCRFHHRLVHEGGWSISVTDRGTDVEVLFRGPRGQQMESLPRGP